MEYGVRNNGNPHGKVYTNRTVVNFMIGTILDEQKSLANKVIIDPAVGTGAFLIPIIERIQEECNGNISAINNAFKNIYVFDIDEIAIEELIENIKDILVDQDSLDFINISVEDYLLSKIPDADIIIGNPPYVRFDNIPNPQREKYSRLYYTFSGRSDIYIPFIEKSLKRLKKDGILTFICADRWFNNSYGKKLRELINHNFNLKSIYKINGFNPFEEEVIAYPSIFLIKNDRGKDGFLYSEIESIEELDKDVEKESAQTLYFNSKSNIEYDNYSNHMYLIEEQDFQIGIGVATGADKIFIIDNLNIVEKDVLIPLITRKDIVDSRIVWGNKYLINTYAKDGKGLLDIDRYPHLKKYLELNKVVLKKRHVAKKNNTNWYKLIDPVKRDLLSKPKLLIPDITTKNKIIYDEGNYYPHHNFYYITSENKTDLLVLRSILSSEFVIKQVSQKGLLMNGGALRWQAQTLRKIYLPLLSQIKPAEKKDLIIMFNTENLKGLNELINKIVIKELQTPSLTSVGKKRDAGLFHEKILQQCVKN